MPYEVITSKAQALDELHDLYEFFELQPIRRGVGPQNADRQMLRIQNLMNYLKTARPGKSSEKAVRE